MCNARYITVIIHRLIFIEKILDNSNILKKSVYFNRIDSYFDLIRPQSAVFRRFLYQQHFPGRGHGYGWEWQKWMKLAFSTTNRTTRNQICFIISNIPTTNHIACNALYISTNHITCNNTSMYIRFITTTSTQIWGGFLFFL